MGILEFRASILENLSFQPESHADYILYRNPQRPELGFSIYYEKPGFYSFGVADYTVCRSFTLPFQHDCRLMRFGTFYNGKAEYQMPGQPVRFTTPSSFLVSEDSLEGTQVWRRGQHFHGAEISLYERFFLDFLHPRYPDAVRLEDFRQNNAYNFLPEEIVRIIERLAAEAIQRQLTPIYLECKLLECMALLTKTVRSTTDNVFDNQLNYGEVIIGRDRTLRLTSSDAKAIIAAHEILEAESAHPPTSAQLSRRVFLNEQKLRAGFRHLYHMSIGEFIHSTRMARAAFLLATTELSVETIAQEVGYGFSGNFSRKFRQTYGKTPLAFRKTKSE